MREHHVGFFDGAASNGECGAGLVIKIGNDLVYNGWLRARKGSNTRAEIVGKALFAKFLGVQSLELVITYIVARLPYSIFQI